jgi:hypothetical protein
VVHRTGSALDLDIHIHVLLLDGVYGLGESNRPATFYPELTPPSPDVIEQIAARVFAQVRGPDRRETAGPPQKFERTLTSAAVEQRSVLGPRAGAIARRVRLEDPDSRPEPPGTVGARGGVEVYAGPIVAPEERVAVIKLAQYVVRPPIDPRRAEPLADGRIRYKLAHPFSDGTTHVEFSPDELGERLLALLPSGPARRLGWHGVLAPRAANRWRVLPSQLVLVESEPEPPSLPKKRSQTLTRPCPRCPGSLEPVAIEEASDSLGLETKSRVK